MIPLNTVEELLAAPGDADVLNKEVDQLLDVAVADDLVDDPHPPQTGWRCRQLLSRTISLQHPVESSRLVSPRKTHFSFALLAGAHAPNVQAMLQGCLLVPARPPCSESARTVFTLPVDPSDHSKIDFKRRVSHRPFESARLRVDCELKLAGDYSRAKSGVSHPSYPRSARPCVNDKESDPKRLLEGNAFIRRLVRIGALDESRMRLDYLKIEDFLERRLHTQSSSGLAKSIHHTRTPIC
ncbi:hypothetical protein C8R44DRAFT_864304 [Mycena epipterygia]|nr:hypothetical protein C8R44DRAFT_864304 [Mycena epipterygia]